MQRNPCRTGYCPGILLSCRAGATGVHLWQDRYERRYQLRADGGGIFCLKLRSVVGGGNPAAREYLNTTKKFEPVMVTLKKGEKLKDVTLKVVLFSGPGEETAPVEKRECKVFDNGALKEVK